ncbi:MAG: hypothetical protein DRP42_05745 [Tenericutes bacterium]|nr:MAG: hypothetical protein DRP42_05745 [Mycoplasmatota bacterium]
MSKSCRECKKLKPFEQYHKNSRAKDGCVNICKVCVREYHGKWYGKNRDRQLELGKIRFKGKWYSNEAWRQGQLKKNRIYRESHKERKKELDSRPEAKEKRREYYSGRFECQAFKKSEHERNKRWKSNNKWWVNAMSSKKRADKNNRTPSWSNLDAIKEFYRSCPKGHQVDHVVPLKGENVSGLHVEYNLQYLTAEENNRKNNRWKNEGRQNI